LGETDVAVQPPVIQMSFRGFPAGPFADGLADGEKLGGKAEAFQRHGQGRQVKIFAAVLKLAAVDETELCSLLQVYQIGARRAGLGRGRQRRRGCGRRSTGVTLSLLAVVFAVARLVRPCQLVARLPVAYARLAVSPLARLPHASHVRLPPG